MPYNEKEYPNSMKNLSKVTRRKAIDILNAMLKDGYDEENAIAISISQAKKWYEDASEYDKKKLREKDITKHKKDNDSARLQDEDVIVEFDDEKDEWKVKTKNSKRADSYHHYKKDAKKRAEEIADKKDSDLEIKNKNK
ncbi:MAG: DUF2188 domain-containing protein [Tissierellia bacterium]|nr:DUF2188 domain-containing protein [Tissierellia bacterium]